MRTLAMRPSRRNRRFGAAATVAGAGRGPGPHPPRGRVRHRSPHFRRLSSVPRISARHRTRIVRARWRRPVRAARSPSASRSYVIPYLACGACVACRRGKTNCCQRIGVLGVHIDGGHGRLRLCPGSQRGARRRHHPRSGGDDRIPGDRRPRGPPRQPAQGRPHSRCRRGADRHRLHAVRQAARAARSPPSTCARTGSTSAAAGLASITRSRRGRIAIETLSALTSGDFFDIVIDATGNVKSMMAGLDYVAHGGTYVLVSVVRDTICFADPEFHKRETSLLGSRNATRQDFAKVFEAMREGLVPTDALVTHRVSLDEAPGSFPDLDQARNGRDQSSHRDLGS